MMTPAERHYAILLRGRQVGTLSQREDHTRLALDEDYIDDPARPVLGLRFEERLGDPYAATMRLPAWFSNLLPEGPLRQWIAEDRGVSPRREMELLAQVGHDLPGAVQVVPTDTLGDGTPWPSEERASAGSGPQVSPEESSPWKFSLAGVALKFSMLTEGDRLTVPSGGDMGDWLVKFPDARYPDVPRNEFTMMSLARAVGIAVPEIRLVHRDELVGLPARMWPGDEPWAYATRRFDRAPRGRGLVHTEDLAQVRDFYPDQKYQGTFETVAALVYCGHDIESLQEFARRLAFAIVVGNGDCHLKNWSLIYHDHRVPTLSPAYDLVSTVAYQDLLGCSEDLGLRFDRSKRFELIDHSSFSRLEQSMDRRFGRTDAQLADIAVQVARQTAVAWPEAQNPLRENPGMLAAIGSWIQRRRATLMGNPG